MTRPVTASYFLLVRVITYMALGGKLIFNDQYSYSSTDFRMCIKVYKSIKV